MIPQIVWDSAAEASAFEPNTHINLGDPYVRGPYFSKISRAMNESLIACGIYYLAAGVTNNDRNRWEAGSFEVSIFDMKTKKVIESRVFTRLTGGFDYDGG